VTDSVAVLDANADSGSIQSTIDTWMTNNSVTSVDDTESVKLGRNRVAIIIMYTA